MVIRSLEKTRMTKTQTLLAVPVIAFTLLAGGAAAGYATLASAQTAGTTTGTAATAPAGMQNRGPHVHGTVTAVSGTTITITEMRDNTTYTIDASAATFKKGTEGAEPTTVTIAEIAVGDEVSAMGTISGTTVTATEVMEGSFMGRGGPGGKGGRGGRGVMGTVSAVNGNVITVTDRDGTSYTVNAGNASVEKMVAGALADIAVGDTIGVDGTKDGTTVTATRIMDDMKAPTAATQ